jgi:hypothetical protein
VLAEQAAVVEVDLDAVLADVDAGRPDARAEPVAIQFRVAVLAPRVVVQLQQLFGDELTQAPRFKPAQRLGRLVAG